MSRLNAVALSLAVVTVVSLGWAVFGALDDRPSQPSFEERSVEGYPRRVELPGGETLELAAPPDRIVPASARCIDLVAALLGPASILALPEQAIEYATLRDNEDLFRDHERFNAYLAEPILQMRPDLVLVDPWQSLDTHMRLREAGIPVLVLPDIGDWAATRGTLLLLGRVLDAEDRARELVSDGDQRVAALRRMARLRPHLGAVSYSNFGARGFTSGDGTTLDEMMTLAGLENLVAKAGREGHSGMTFEDLLLFDPDVIVVSQPLNAPSGHAGDRGGASERILLSEKSLAGLRAVRERRIISLPAGLFASASHNIVRGAELLAAEVDMLRARLEAEGVEVSTER